MNYSELRSVLAASLILLLSACFNPNTPQTVSQAFWEAVVKNDAVHVVNTSTLTEARYYDGFSMDWKGYQPSFGKVIIDEKTASIESVMVSPPNSGQEDRHFTTYLVLAKGQWQVDYDRTRLSVQGGPLGVLADKLSQAGSELSRQLAFSADAFKMEMERLGKDLKEYSDKFGQQASTNIEQYAEQLRHGIKELEESINRALKDEENKLSNDDKSRLREIADELEREDRNLSAPDVDAVTRGGKRIGEKQQQLEAIDNDALDEYRQVWRDIGSRLETSLRQLMDEQSSQNDSSASNKTF